MTESPPLPSRLSRLACALLVATLALLAAPPARAQTHDPQLEWLTLETAHFRIHYDRPLRPQAARIAELAEAVYDRIGTMMGHHPSEVTEVVLTDNTDDANGSATAIPYNTIRLYVTAPEDLSTLGDYDEWFRELVTHEFTHIAHTDNISGLPAVINAILGKVYPPNQVQPRWILEGLAVYVESHYTTGGRLRGSTWDMYLRADALEDRFVTLDQLCTGPNRWPHGDIYYLYGSYFIEWLCERFGEQILREMSTFYGGQLIPYGINRALQRSTGFTYEQLYPQFLAAMRERYVRQRREIGARGLREGVPLTAQGDWVQYPRFLPDGHTVAYYSDDGETHAQLRTVDLTAPHPRPRDGDWVASNAGFAFSADGSRMILGDTGIYRDIYFFHELYERRARLSPGGALETTDNRQLTNGWRALYPDLAPDGRHVAFTSNHGGTRALFELSLDGHSPRPLIALEPYEQVYTPRYSPDGRSIVFSEWRTGGSRDIRLLDRATSTVRDLTHDRAVDMQPVFTPDGRYVVFSSDRTGVSNLYALELETGRLAQVTNVVNGAFMPAVSPDGQTLVYVGYSSRGFDLYRMPFDPSRWLEPLEAPERAGDTIPTHPVASRTHPFEPFTTLRPRSWSAGFDQDGFGPLFSLMTSGSDVLGNHAFTARLTLGYPRFDPQFDVTYYYGGLRPDLRLHAYRTVAPSRWHVGNSDPTFATERWGGDAQFAINFPGLFSSHTLWFSYETQYSTPMGVPFGRYVDPNELATVPPRPTLDTGVRASWQFSRVQRYAYDVSASEGFETLLSVHASDQVLGRAEGALDVSWAGAAYLRMPWAFNRRHHVLALHLAGGWGASASGQRTLFYVGGFPSYGPVDFITSLVTLSTSGGVALRGYPQYSRAGDQYHLLNVEYRFPIFQVDRGVTTLPVYLTRLYGGAFCDVGDAFFGPLRLQDFAVGIGAELLADVTIGYVLPYTLRVGIARGLTGADAVLQGYALLSAPF